MKIDINKKYKTRGGKKVIIHSINGPNKNYPVIASIECAPDNWQTFMYSSTGGYYLHMGYSLDLIEVKEKKQLTGFVNVYLDGTYYVRPTKNKADEVSTEGRIACIDLSQYEIFYEENEGL